jgi:hypothetical protein
MEGISPLLLPTTQSVALAAPTSSAAQSGQPRHEPMLARTWIRVLCSQLQRGYCSKQSKASVLDCAVEIHPNAVHTFQKILLMAL